MKVWKKAASLSLVLLLAMMSGCGSDKKDDSTNNNANATDTSRKTMQVKKPLKQ